MSSHGLTGHHVEVLRQLATWVAQVYLPMYFSIKVQHHIVYGARHLLTLLRLWRQQDPAVQGATKHYVKIEAWWAHSEPLLLTMLSSDDASDRTFAISKILSIRGSAEIGSSSIRYYDKPKSVNMMATSCKELISWDEEQLSEPVFTASLSTSELRSLEDAPLRPPRYSIHTQSCERAVKCVTEAAKEVCGWERRHRLILTRCKHRKMMPILKTKKQNMKVFEN